MVIQKLGGYCFKLTAGSATLAINPPSPKSSFKVNKFGSDMVLISLRHEDWDGGETASHGDKDPFIAVGPGEYEVGDITVSGFATMTDYEGMHMEVGNTAYLIDMDGIRVLVLGALSSPKLPQDLRSELDTVGIVFVPVGEGALDPKSAHELMVAIEPKIIIPYAMKGKASAADIAAFVKAEGESMPKAVDKLTLRSKEVDAKDGEIVIFE